MALKKTFRSIIIFLLTMEDGQIPECGQHPALVSSIFAPPQNSYLPAFFPLPHHAFTSRHGKQAQEVWEAVLPQVEVTSYLRNA